MTAMCSLLFADLPPYVMCQGQPAGARSMNYEGLRRRGFSADRVACVKAMHKALYRDNLPLAGARAQIEGLVQAYPDSAADVQLMVSFLDQVAPGRGIVR
jgi:UDP-N-acetylglucosamine acyltransferase